MSNSSPAATARALRCSVVRVVIDIGVLTLVSIGFACVLTAHLQTQRMGWVWPTTFDNARSDVLLHALLASLLVAPVGLLIGRVARVRRSPSWQTLLFALLALLVIRLGPPDAQVFGTTWTQWEITQTLFLQQWALVLPLVGVALLLRRLLREATDVA